PPDLAEPGGAARRLILYLVGRTQPLGRGRGRDRGHGTNLMGSPRASASSLMVARLDAVASREIFGSLASLRGRLPASGLRHGCDGVGAAVNMQNLRDVQFEPLNIFKQVHRELRGHRVRWRARPRMEGIGLN